MASSTPPIPENKAPAFGIDAQCGEQRNFLRCLKIRFGNTLFDWLLRN